MEIKDIPNSLEAAYRVVDDYIASDVTSAETKDGRDLTNSITDLLCKYHRRPALAALLACTTATRPRLTQLSTSALQVVLVRA